MLVVGAPCGVMDQMAASLGRSSSLMALTCQPAEVSCRRAHMQGAACEASRRLAPCDPGHAGQGRPERPTRLGPVQLHDPVEIPASAALYGIDSGQRHSVGGLDYGTVRAAAFIGLQMLARLGAGQQPGNPGEAQQALCDSCGTMLAGTAPDQEGGVGWGAPLAREDRYLVHTAPSTFARLQQRVPEQLEGRAFQAWGWQHWDGATTVTAGVSLAPAGLGGVQCAACSLAGGLVVRPSLTRGAPCR